MGGGRSLPCTSSPSSCPAPTDPHGAKQVTDDAGATSTAQHSVTLDQQSEAPWSAFNRNAAVTVSIDLQSMDLQPATVSDSGTWTVATWHGQAVLRQHPLPFRKNPNAVKPTEADLAVDAAHFASLRTM
eukprot:3913324-Rhodomonas_salina.1